MEYTAELFKHRPKQVYKQRLSRNTIPRNQRGVFSESNLFFCPAASQECCEMIEESWQDAGGKVDSKLRGTMQKKTRDEIYWGRGGNRVVACQRKNTC